MKTLATIIGGLILFVGAILLLGLLMSWPVYLLWNSCLFGTVPGVNKLESIWHAWGILILCGFLFKSSFSSSKKSD